MTEFVLEILDGDRVGEIFELASEPLTFGRRQGNDIVLKDEKCSGRHAQVVLEDGSWVLRDLDSTNGTLMDGRKIDEVGLTANDIFQTGHMPLYDAAARLVEVLPHDSRHVPAATAPMALNECCDARVPSAFSRPMVAEPPPLNESPETMP